MITISCCQNTECPSELCFSCAEMDASLAFLTNDNFERKKIVPKPGFEPQISSFPYWRLNNWPTETRIPPKEQTSLSFKFQSRTLINATCYNSLESNPQVGILVWIYLYSLLTSHLVVYDINIENIVYQRAYR